MKVSITKALSLIYETVKPLDETEFIDIIEAVDRIAAKNIASKIDLPKFDHSAMDGYGIKMKDQGCIRAYTRTIFAGDKSIEPLKEDEIIKIMTGAPIPQGVEAVVPVENTTEENGKIRLPKEIKLGANIRKKGEELKSGSICVKKGEMINSYTIALLASQGIKKIEVHKKINALILSNGNELKNHEDENIDTFEIYNSNTPMLHTRLKTLGCCSSMEQSIMDDLEYIKKNIQKAIKKNHLVIITGGASMGDKDFTKQALKELGVKMLFEMIDIKPGKPTAVCILNETVIVSLPGNPLAAMVNFELFVSPIIAILQGAKDVYHNTIKTTFGNDHKLKPGRYSVICGKFTGKCFMPLKNNLQIK